MVDIVDHYSLTLYIATALIQGVHVMSETMWEQFLKSERQVLIALHLICVI